MKAEDVVNGILEAAEGFKLIYDISPLDVCLGPEEYFVLRSAVNDISPIVKEETLKALAPEFFKGMRVRRLSSPGILVGCLTGRPPTPLSTQPPR